MNRVMSFQSFSKSTPGSDFIRSTNRLACAGMSLEKKKKPSPLNQMLLHNVTTKSANGRHYAGSDLAWSPGLATLRWAFSLSTSPRPKEKPLTSGLYFLIMSEMLIKVKIYNYHNQLIELIFTYGITFKKSDSLTHWPVWCNPLLPYRPLCWNRIQIQ